MLIQIDETAPLTQVDWDHLHELIGEDMNAFDQRGQIVTNQVNTGHVSPFLTAEEAAAYCRVSITTMQDLLRKGHIQARQVGRQWRILKKELDAYLGL